jgi:hypothetical protein
VGIQSSSTHLSLESSSEVALTMVTLATAMCGNCSELVVATVLLALSSSLSPSDPTSTTMTVTTAAIANARMTAMKALWLVLIARRPVGGEAASFEVTRERWDPIA